MADGNTTALSLGLPQEFKTGSGEAFTLDIAAAQFAFSDLLDTLPPDTPQRDYLRQCAEWVAEHAEPAGVQLSLAELDRLKDLCAELFAQKKRDSYERIAGKRTSPSSTPSTPSD